MTSSKLSRQEFLILDIIVSHQREMFAAEIVSASRGQLRKGGGIYVTLSRMIDRGLLMTRIADDPFRGAGPPRPLYSPAESGEFSYKATLAELKREGRSEALGKPLLISGFISVIQS